MSELPVQSYLSLVTEIGSRFAGSKSELISGASSSAVKFCRMISSVFCFFCNSFFSRTVAACFLMGASQAMTYDNSKNFKSIPLTKTMEACIAVKSGEGILLSILNKTLKTMPSDMLTSALAIYDSTADKVTFSDFVKDNMFAFLSRQDFSYLASLVLSSYFYRRREKQKLSQGLLQMIHKSLMTSWKSL